MAERYCVAGYRTTVKLRSVTVSVVVAAICPWKASTIVYDSESYAFSTPAAKPSTVPQLWTDNWQADVLAPASAQPEIEASAHRAIALHQQRIAPVDGEGETGERCLRANSRN